MKYCIAVTEILRRTIIVKTKDAGVDSLEKTIDCMRDAHNAQEIILDADDLIPDYTTGKPASFCVANWIDPDEIQKWMLILLYEIGIAIFMRLISAINEDMLYC